MECIAKQEDIDEVLHAMIHCNAYDKLVELVDVITTGMWQKMSGDEQDELLDKYYESLSK